MKDFMPQIIATVVLFVTFPILKFITRRILEKFANISGRANRTNHIVRVILSILNILWISLLIMVWGVKPGNIWVAVSSMFAVIGVAFFAQWSILSNVTAGIIIFFSSPFKIGDKVHILDKEAPIEAEIEDILTFHTHLRTPEGELIIYPNNLFLQKGILVKSVQE